METIAKYKMPLIIAGVVLLLVAIYFAFGRSTSDQDKSDNNSCPGSFAIYPIGLLSGYVGTTYTSSGGKYFKQVKGEAMGASGQLPPKEISKDEFLAACKSYKTPNA